MRARAEECLPTPPHPEDAIKRMEKTINLPRINDQFSVGESKYCFLLTLSYDTHSFRHVYWEDG